MAKKEAYTSKGVRYKIFSIKAANLRIKLLCLPPDKYFPVCRL